MQASTILQFGDLASQKIDKFKYKSGEFVNELYEIFINFNNCNGVIELIWQVKFDEYRNFHQKQSQLLLVMAFLYNLVIFFIGKSCLL